MVGLRLVLQHKRDFLRFVDNFTKCDVALSKVKWVLKFGISPKFMRHANKLTIGKQTFTFVFNFKSRSPCALKLSAGRAKV